jgi:hypothetical protein
MIVAEIVDLDALWKTIVGALAAGVGITLAFSVALFGWARAHESRLQGRDLPTGLWALVILLGAAVIIAGLVFGMTIMVDK